MEVHDPPYPEYREQGAWPTHEEDVHEVIAWAESHIDEYTDPEGHSERTYVLYAKVPDEPWMLHLAGVDPTVQPVHNTFRRQHPLPG